MDITCFSMDFAIEGFHYLKVVQLNGDSYKLGAISH
jgi:hypothetical protein